jgi:o-succinylbenzoate---CoA ligase
MELQKTIDQAIDILRRWEQGDTHFSLTTSGSTGEPATIEHCRAALQWSAESTQNTWFTTSNPPNEHTSFTPIQLCILPLNKAGGFMQLIRSAVWNAPIWIGPASANPFSESELALIKNGEVIPFSPELWNQYKPNILSITPMQLQLALKSETGQEILNQMHTVLIGGQAMDLQLEKQILKAFPNTRWIHTFGSTETASHFAGRILNHNTAEYTLTAGSSLNTNESGEIQISNPATNGRRITLYDKIQLTSDTTFIWLERTNLLVNSGGVKIPIEPLEKEISILLNWPLHSFYIAGQPHPILGEELTLFTTHSINDMQRITDSLSQLHKLHQPKKILFISEITISDNGKIVRKINP